MFPGKVAKAASGVNACGSCGICPPVDGTVGTGGTTGADLEVVLCVCVVDTIKPLLDGVVLVDGLVNTSSLLPSGSGSPIPEKVTRYGVDLAAVEELAAERLVLGGGAPEGPGAAFIVSLLKVTGGFSV